MEEKVFFKSTLGSNICGIVSNSNGDVTKPIVILVHGFASYKNTNSIMLIKTLLEAKGLATFRIDTYGCGDSEGNFEDITLTEGIDEVLQAINFIQQKGYTKIGLFGTSFGGSLAMMAAAESDVIKVLALKSPVTNFEEQFNSEFSVQEIEQWKEIGYHDYLDGDKIVRVNYTLYEDAIRNNGWEVAPQVKMPTIIVHGDTDEEVPVQQSEHAATLFPNCELVIVQGADHRYSQEAHKKEMSEKITGFLADNIMS